VETNLKSKSFQGVIWKTIERFGSQIMLFIIGIVLARLLDPAEFGLIGILAFFIAIAQEFVDSGFSTSLIRTKDPQNIDFTTIFWFNLFVAILTYAFLFISAGYISSYYGEPILKDLTRVLTLNIIINAFGSTQRIHYIKKIDFKTQALVNLFSIVVGGVVGVIMAYNGYGVWALVGKNLTQTLLINILFWSFSNWKPDFQFSFEILKKHFKFGSKLLLSGILSSTSRHFYNLAIGKAFTTQTLGFYTRARQFQQLPVSSIQGVGISVLFPVMSNYQDNKKGFVKGYKMYLKLISYLLFPLMFLMILIAEPMIVLLLTDKWIAVVPMLKILCISGLFVPIHSINVNALLVKGRSDYVLYLDIIKIILMFINVFIGIKLGIIALIWGITIQSFLFLFINRAFSAKVLDYPMFNQLKDITITLLFSVLIYFVLYFLLIFIKTDLYKIIISISLGGILYFFLSYIFKIEEYSQLVNLVKKQFLKK